MKLHEEFKLFEDMWDEDTQGLQEATKKVYTETDLTKLNWDTAAIIDMYKHAVLAYMNGANLEDALHDIKVDIISGVANGLTSDPTDFTRLINSECKKYGITEAVAPGSDKYYYVVCLLNTTRGKKVLDAGVHRLYSNDVDYYSKKGYDLAELAMTDFWDATGIAYRSTWTDAKWDELERYVYEIDEATYKNRRTLPQTDKEILKYVEDSVAEYKE
jgi:hypothetical protein